MITIRRIQIGEADLFRQIRLASLLDAPYAFSSTYGSAVQRSAQSWQEQADSTARGRDRGTFIAFSGETPIGIAALYRLDDLPETGELLQVWVHPAYRGTAVAWDLMDAIFAWAQENSFRAVKAVVAGGNPRAIRFYTRYGFSPIDEPSPSEPNAVCLLKQVEQK